MTRPDKGHPHTELTEARRLLAEGRPADAERLARACVRDSERAGESRRLAEALTILAVALARQGRDAEAEILFGRVAEEAAAAGDRAAAGEAALATIEELGGRLDFRRAVALYTRASEMLAGSTSLETLKRLDSCARMILRGAARVGTGRDVSVAFAESGGLDRRGTGDLPTGVVRGEVFSLREAVRSYEAQIIERALKEAGGVVTRAARLLGFKHHNSLIALLNTRHRDLLSARTPVVPRRPRARAGTAEAARGEESEALTVLYVEDDRFVADAVRTTLTAEGLKVVVCWDGFAGLKMIESNVRYDLLLVDQDLPGPSGLELVRQARRLEHRRETPVIMLSAGGRAAEARRAGVNVFLRKPEDIASLPEAVARLLETSPESDAGASHGDG